MTEVINKRDYMREYKKKKYSENPEEFKIRNKMYYVKYKYGVSDDDCKKYGNCLPEVVKIWNAMNKLKESNPELIKDIISPYKEN